jgi:hypothetical protein
MDAAGDGCERTVALAEQYKAASASAIGVAWFSGGLRDVVSILAEGADK